MDETLFVLLTFWLKGANDEQFSHGLKSGAICDSLDGPLGPLWLRPQKLPDYGIPYLI